MKIKEGELFCEENDAILCALKAFEEHKNDGLKMAAAAAGQEAFRSLAKFLIKEGVLEITDVKTGSYL